MSEEGGRPGRHVPGQRLALVLIVGFCAIGVGALVYRDYAGSSGTAAQEPSVAPTPEEEVVRTSVRARLIECNRLGGGRTGMRGEIINTGTMDLHYVTVRAIWKNSAGLEIGSEQFYAMSGGELAPGETKLFEHSTTLQSASRCNVESVDWW